MVEKNTVDIIATKNRFGDNIPFDRKKVPRPLWNRIKFSSEDVQDHRTWATSTPRALRRDQHY